MDRDQVENDFLCFAGLFFIASNVAMALFLGIIYEAWR